MILTFDSVNWFNDLLRGLFGAIDYLVYTIISWILEGIFNLSSIAANRQFVEILYKRIYVVLAIFMVFKLTVSFIQYLVNPDAMADKEKGVGKLIARTITMLVMLIALPILFFEPMPGRSGNETILNVLQTGVIKTIPKLVLGIDSSKDANNSAGINASEYGKYMAVMMLRSFYYPSECNPDSPAYDSSANCDLVESDNITDMNGFYNSLEVPGNKKVYAYQYMWPLTTIAGVLLVIILVGLAIDVAIRVFKMVLLQMIAPVPVMSYIDPKSSKDGAFASWMKQFTQTYIELFLKLTVIYMLLLIISKLFATGDNALFGDSLSNIKGFMPKTFVYVFLTIGLFKFVKDAPKFIKDALGIKDNGGGGGMMGKMAGGLAGAAAGFAGGGLAGAVTGAKAGYAASGTGKPANAYSSARDAKAKALGRPEGGLAGRLNQAGLRRTVKKKTGLDADSLAAAKKNMLNAQAEADEWAGYQRQAEANMAADGSSFFVDKDGNKHDLNNAARWQAFNSSIAEASSNAAKAKSKYDDASQIAKSVGIKKGFMDDSSNRRHGKIYQAVRMARETSVGDAVSNAVHVPGALVSEAVHRAGDARYLDYDQVLQDRADLREARDTRDAMYEGGFMGPESTRLDRDAARADVAAKKEQLKIDKNA